MSKHCLVQYSAFWLSHLSQIFLFSAQGQGGARAQRGCAAPRHGPFPKHPTPDTQPSPQLCPCCSLGMKTPWPLPPQLLPVSTHGSVYSSQLCSSAFVCYITFQSMSLLSISHHRHFPQPLPFLMLFQRKDFVPASSAQANICLFGVLDLIDTLILYKHSKGLPTPILLLLLLFFDFWRDL